MIETPMPISVPLSGSKNSPSTGQFELMGSRQTTMSLAHGRLVLIRLFFTFAYLGLAIRAFDIMILQGELSGYRAHVGLNTSIVSTTSIPRRDIIDKNGLLLATSIKTASLYADPRYILNPELTAQGLVRIFPDQNYGDLLQKFQSDKRFVWIKRNITPDEQAAILELGQPGLNFQEEYRRIYPEGPLAAHVIGYNDIDSDGLSGIERGLNKVLSTPGNPIKLTIDIRLQHILRREIETTMHDFTATGGAGVIMDVRTGAVMALVSLPDFDPHQIGNTKDTQKFNRATLATYELGSTFKIFTTAAAFEQLNLPMSQSYDTRQPIKVGRFTISDFHPENRNLTIPEVFMHSSNIGTAMMAQQIGTDGLKSFYEQLGFFNPVSFDLPETGRPIVPKPWRDVTTLTASYGHGIAITPLHLAAATATIVGDGTVVHPYLIERDTKKIQDTATRVVSEQTVQKMRALMRLVVSHGTAQKANVSGLFIGGKTGTAEKNLNGKYVHNALVSSFVGAFPMNDPQYVVLVTIDDPKPNAKSYGYATAGWTAVPAVGRIIAGMSAVLAIAPQSNVHDPADVLTPYLAEFCDPNSETPKMVTRVAACISVP